MKEYCPYLTSFLSYTAGKDDEREREQTTRFGNINQILIDYLENKNPDNLIKDIEQLKKDYRTSSELAYKLSDLGLDIDISSDYWGGFKDVNEFLEYLLDYLKSE